MMKVLKEHDKKAGAAFYLPNLVCAASILFTFFVIKREFYYIATDVESLV